MNVLLGIQNDKEIVAAVANGHRLTGEYATSEAHAATCVIDDIYARSLRPFWGEINCEHNRSLATMFTFDFIQTHPSYRADKGIIIAHFLKRLQRLKNLLP